MNLHPHVGYWDHGVKNVAAMTGALGLLDAHDIMELCQVMGIKLPLRSALDVGCGTGRVAPLCRSYVGVDIAPSSIEYCVQNNLNAYLISGADSLGQWRTEWTLALSLFTHMDRTERRAYLAKFRSKYLLADIIPGDGSGEVAKWTADVTEFMADLDEANYKVVRTADKVGLDHVFHQYFWAQKP